VRGLAATVRADTALHALWELHGKHNTVYILGSIHVLRPTDYPLAPPFSVHTAMPNRFSWK